MFYRFDAYEAYETSEGSITRVTRDNHTYLGDYVNPFKATDVEGLRVKRALSLLEKSGGRLLRQTKDKRSGQGLAVLLRQVFSFDATQFTPGMRSIYQGLLSAQGRALLKGFDYNAHSAPGALLNDAYRLDLENGVLCWPDFSPERLLLTTAHASQLQVCFLLSRVDFSLGEFFTICSEVATFTAKDPVQDLRLEVGERPDCDGVLLAYLWIGFKRDDAVAVPELLWHVDDVFRILECVF